MDYPADRFGHYWRGVIREYRLHAFREEWLKLGDGLAQCLGGIQGVGPGRQFDRQTGSRFAVELGADGIVLAAKADGGNIAQTYLRAVTVDLEQDLFELLGGLQTGLADDRGIELGAGQGRQAAELTGGNLDVLRRDGGAHIDRGQLVLVQLGRIEPDTHRILGTEHLEVTDTGGPRDRVLHVGHDVVGQVVLGHAAIFRDQTDYQQEVLHRLGNTDTLLLHFLRQQRGRQVQLVLHLNLGSVGVGPLLEGRGDGHGAVGVTFRRDITQVVDTVELLLDHLNHGVLNRLCRSTRVGHGDGDRWRRNARVLVDRQSEDR
ncbi:hypothetical protein D3C81_1365840 [compost metagenome]